MEEKQEEKKEEMITISKGAFESFKKDMAQIKKDNELLLSVADKKALALHYQRHSEDIPKIVKLRVIDDKLVLGWSTIRDKGSFQVPGTRMWKEDQVIEVVFEDGTNKEYDYMDFARIYDHVRAKVVGTITNEVTKGTDLKVIREDNGKELTIGVQFIN